MNEALTICAVLVVGGALVALGVWLGGRLVWRTTGHTSGPGVLRTPTRPRGTPGVQYTNDVAEEPEEKPKE